MAEIIPLSAFKEKTAIKDGFKYWRSLFEEPLDGKTRLSDLRPETLSYLSEPVEESSFALHALIIGFLGKGASTTFDELSPRVQCRIIDISLFISDQIRFEMMHRLGWVEHFYGNQHPLYQMITGFERIKAQCNASSPTLSKNHRDYASYDGLIERDQQVFIRRLFPAALTAFNTYHHLR